MISAFVEEVNRFLEFEGEKAWTQTDGYLTNDMLITVSESHLSI